jgi:hypothetical protein
MLKIVVIVCGGSGSGNSGGQYTVFFFFFCKGFAYVKIVNMALKFCTITKFIIIDFKFFKHNFKVCL